MQSASGRGDHRRYEDMAVAHVLGGLDEHSGQLFRAHLVDCPDCRARVGELRSIASDLAGVEQRERRAQALQAVDTKSREGEGAASPPRGGAWRSRLVVFAGVVALIALAAYVFTLRGQVASLQTALDERLDAAAALEHGDAVPLDYLAPGLTGTVKTSGDDVVVLLEGVSDDQSYGVYLLQGEGEDTRTLRRMPARAADGRLFFLVELRGDEERLVVVEPSTTQTPATPGAGTANVLEAPLPEGTPAG